MRPVLKCNLHIRQRTNLILLKFDRVSTQIDFGYSCGRGGCSAARCGIDIDNVVLIDVGDLVTDSEEFGLAECRLSHSVFDILKE